MSSSTNTDSHFLKPEVGLEHFKLNISKRAPVRSDAHFLRNKGLVVIIWPVCADRGETAQLVDLWITWERWHGAQKQHWRALKFSIKTTFHNSRPMAESLIIENFAHRSLNVLILAGLTRRRNIGGFIVSRFHITAPTWNVSTSPSTNVGKKKKKSIHACRKQVLFFFPFICISQSEMQTLVRLQLKSKKNTWLFHD